MPYLRIVGPLLLLLLLLCFVPARAGAQQDVPQAEDELLLDDDDLLLDDDDLLLDDDDLLLGDDDDLLLDDEDAGQEPATAAGDAAHISIFLENRFPSAATCASCHPRHYREWSVSPHAYAQLSPVFNAMHGRILKLTNGTNGDFCIRCHTPVGMILNEPLFVPNEQRHPTSREGVTCIACHRVNEAYGRVSGRIRVVEGDIYQPVYGPSGNRELERVIADPTYRVVTDSGEPGRAIHSDAEHFFHLTTPGFCGSCHDVVLVNGFRLEDAFSEYKSSPAARRGVTCQDCHMSTQPGEASGYASGPAAVIGELETKPRKLTDHMFPGPDYSIVHPGIFPHNVRAGELATISEWVEFDYEAGWGTDAFEDSVSEEYEFPIRWWSIDERYDAREIIEENRRLLGEIEQKRLALLQAGYRLGDIVVDRADERGLKFRVRFENGIDGHGVPTGFDAERVVFLRVTVSDREGTVVFRSGDLDPNGDLRDLHSLYVHNGEVPVDKQLFSLQSKFVTRMVRGGEREQVLAVNYSASPLPFLRPEPRPTSLYGRPRGARKHKMVIEPNGHRWARYAVDRSALTGKPPYTADVAIVTGMVPVNLIHEIQSVGFDYRMSAREIADAVVAGHQVVWQQRVELTLDPRDE